ncbi:hypothetical protein CBR_g20394 [Chara braunii]|uniref:Era-type G domain-containing protein n=1 Tax=Chara braunii TaxID=69332 RepID=A0A388JU88_CHABU|nr:hypothetical protein CBR_g20394 [Chara braunii]|eukprot:GBG61361.1 hypothetical protein CBR_g20394 [Chara braunii]
MAASAAAAMSGSSIYRIFGDCSCMTSGSGPGLPGPRGGGKSLVGLYGQQRDGGAFLLRRLRLRKQLDGAAIAVDEEKLRRSVKKKTKTNMEKKRSVKTKLRPRPMHDDEQSAAIAEGRSLSSSSDRCTLVQAAAGNQRKNRYPRPGKSDGSNFSVGSDGWLEGYDGEAYRNSHLATDHKSGYVALLGKPNVGKSTLINQLIGQKICIVTHKPQTTRHRILGIMSDRDYQVILFDTPGIIPKQRHKLDEVMMRNLRYAMANADAILMIVDGTEPLEPVQAVVEEGQDRALRKRPTLLALNKIDLLKPADVSLRYKWFRENGGIDDVVPISAKTGSGVSLLKDWILDNMPYGPVYYPKDIVSEHSTRFFVSEILREKIFLLYHQEVPYCSQVQVTAYREREPNKKDYIEMEIYVEKETQKGILLGKGGMALKELAVAARKDIEQFVGKPVYLELRVKVKEGWREDEESLTRFGLDGKTMGRAAF